MPKNALRPPPMKPGRHVVTSHRVQPPPHDAKGRFTYTTPSGKTQIPTTADAYPKKPGKHKKHKAERAAAKAAAARKNRKRRIVFATLSAAGVTGAMVVGTHYFPEQLHQYIEVITMIPPLAGFLAWAYGPPSKRK